jgi:hypothetical protein|tara:strand:+ start:1705 stop:1815 length:111 start_codon:yes stop_codon:yes gene_type:complete
VVSKYEIIMAAQQQKKIKPKKEAKKTEAPKKSKLEK